MIKIICIGIIKKTYLKEAVKEYLLLLNNSVTIIELPNSNIKDENELILSKIKKDDYVITCIVGESTISSVDLANKISNIETYNSPNIVFVIGGSEGLLDIVLNRSDYHLSFSKLTFPHQLFRVMLLEQIYRARCILINHPYHK